MITDMIEFYNQETGALVVSVKSSMVPDIGRRISIRKETWNVQAISYAVDHSDDALQRKMRCNVDLLLVREI
jgi:hypothetical protein